MKLKFNQFKLGFFKKVGVFSYCLNYVNIKHKMQYKEGENMKILDRIV